MLFLNLRKTPTIIGENIYLRPPKRNDKKIWLQLRYASKDHLQFTEPDYGAEFASARSFQLYRLHMKSLKASARGEGWLIFKKQTETHSLNIPTPQEQLIGSITLSNMRFGSVKSADIGYWIGKLHTRQGLMSEAINLILHRAFRYYKLNRLAAATLPQNRPSRKLLEKFGFQYEGIARKYLQVNGEFHDHCLYALLAEDYLGII